MHWTSHGKPKKKVMLPCVCHTLVSLVSLLVLLYTVLLALPVEFNWDRVSSTGDITALPPSASYISVQTGSTISLQVLQAGDPQSPLPLLILLHGFPGTHTGGRTMNLTLVVPQFPPQQQLPTKTDWLQMVVSHTQHWLQMVGSQHWLQWRITITTIGGYNCWITMLNYNTGYNDELQYCLQRGITTHVDYNITTRLQCAITTPTLMNYNTDYDELQWWITTPTLTGYNIWLQCAITTPTLITMTNYNYNNNFHWLHQTCFLLRFCVAHLPPPDLLLRGQTIPHSSARYARLQFQLPTATPVGLPPAAARRGCARAAPFREPHECRCVRARLGRVRRRSIRSDASGTRPQARLAERWTSECIHDGAQQFPRCEAHVQVHSSPRNPICPSCVYAKVCECCVRVSVWVLCVRV